MIPKVDVTAACSLAQRVGDNPPWHGAKILVVEDNYLQAEVVSDFLARKERFLVSEKSGVIHP